MPPPCIAKACLPVARWPRWLVYLLAVAITVGMLLIRLQLAPSFGDRPLLILLVLPIVVSSLLGGIGPGLVSTLATAAAAAWFIPPADTLLIEQTHDLFQWIIFILNGVLVSVLSELLHRAHRETEAARRMLTDRLRTLQLFDAIVDSSTDAIFAKDGEDRFLVFNGAAARLTGKQPEEVLGKDERAIFPPELAQQLIADNRRVMAEQRVLSFQEDLITTDGVKTYLTTKGPLHGPDGRSIGMFGIARDITDLKRLGDSLRRTNRALRTLSECNQALVRAADEQQLLDEICRLLVEHGGYRMAWVGYAEDDPIRTVRPMAKAGFDAGYLADAHITWADDEHGRGPTGTAIRERRPVAARDIHTDPHFAAWRKAALARGYASSIALPLLDGEGCLGALNLYAAETKAFDAEEVQLLTELADDLAYGIRAQRDRVARERAETERRFWVQAFERAEFGLAIADCTDNTFRTVNPDFARQRGYTPEELVGRPVMAVYPPEVRAEIEARIAQIDRDGHGIFESVHLRRDSSRFPVLLDITVIRDAEGRQQSRVAYALDITERKRARETLARQTEELKARNAELERFNRAMVGRELDMVEMKRRINDLSLRIGQEPPYPLDFLQGEDKG